MGSVTGARRGMRALTLWRPWPWSIFFAPLEVRKAVENRPWKPWPSIINQTIALHAGMKFDSDDADFICTKVGLHPDGSPPQHWDEQGIIGTARVTRWFAYPEDHLLPGLPPSANIPPGQERWCFGPFCWVLEDVKALPAPIPCRGMQGLWVVPPAIEAQIRRAA